MGALQQVVTAIRTLRSEMNVTPGKPITCLVKTSEEPWITDFKDAEWASIIKTLARAPSMTVGAEVNRPPSSAVAVFNGGEIYVPLEDMAKEKARLEKNLAHLKDAIGRDMQMLSNPDFKQRAAQEEVQRVADRWNQNSKKAALLERNLQGL
jgi:valyl-tRNA synthetase